MLESANKATGIKRVVITASILSISGLSDIGTGVIVDGT